MRRRAFRRANLLVFLAAVAAYATACLGGFLYDDVHSVRDNEALRSLANLPRLLTDPTAFSALDGAMWRPLLLVTFAVNHAMGDGAALPFKITDVLLHGLAAIALASVARALGASLRASTTAALLFAVHPFASEAVNFVSARSDQLLALGALLALRAQLAWRDGTRGAWLGVVAGTLIACGSKETGALVPALVLGVDGALTLRGAGARAALRDAFRRAWPSLAVAVVYLIARRVLLGVATADLPRLDPGDVAVGAGRDLVTQLCVAAMVATRFLAQSLLPIQLTPDPPIPLLRDLTDPRVAVGLALVLGFTIAGLAQWKRRPLVFAGTLLAWVVALPWLLVPLNAPAGEHRFYGGLAGLALVAAGWLRSSWLRRRAVRTAVRCVVVGLGIASATLSLDFRSEEALWTRAKSVDPASAAAACGLAQVEQDLASEAQERGDLDAVRAHLRAAIDLGVLGIAWQPTAMSVRRQLVRIRLALGPEHGEPLLALAEARALVARRPRNPGHRILLSQALTQAGQRAGETRFFDEAERMALSCLTLAPPKGLVWRVAAEARAARGDLPGAVAQLVFADGTGYATPPVRLDRAELLLKLGRTDAARADIRAALVESPFDPRARALATQSSAPPR